MQKDNVQNQNNNSGSEICKLSVAMLTKELLSTNHTHAILNLQI